MSGGARSLFAEDEFVFHTAGVSEPGPRPHSPRPLPGRLSAPSCAPSAPGPAVEVHVPAEPLSAPVGKTAELTCSYRTTVTDSFALEWSFVQPGKPVSASLPVSESGGPLACDY